MVSILNVCTYLSGRQECFTTESSRHNQHLQTLYCSSAAVDDSRLLKLENNILCREWPKKFDAILPAAAQLSIWHKHAPTSLSQVGQALSLSPVAQHSQVETILTTDLAIQIGVLNHR